MRPTRIITIVVVVAIILAHAHGSSGASTPPYNDIARFYSGVSNLSVYCAPNDAEWDAVTHKAGYSNMWVDGFTYPGTSNRTVYLAPWICEAIARGPRYTEFASGIETLVHEAYHWRFLPKTRWGSEGSVECIALISVKGVILNYWGIGPNTPDATRIDRDARAYSKQRPPEYQDCTEVIR